MAITIDVLVGDVLRTRQFDGKWIIGDDKSPALYEREWPQYRATFEGHSVLRTEKGAFVVFSHDRHESPTMEVFGSVDDIESALIDNRFEEYPKDLVTAIRAALDPSFGDVMDI